MSVQWPLLLFSVFLGASAGMLFYLGACEVRGKRSCAGFLIAILAVVLLAVGGCASTLHLGHPERALHIMGNMGSGLSRELIAVGITGVAAIAYAVCARGNYARAGRVLGVVCLIMGVVLPIIAGSSFMMPARPAWDSVALPLMYLGTGLGLGLTLSALIVSMKDAPEEERAFSVKLALFGIVAAAVVTLAYTAWIACAPHPDETRSIMRLITGDLAVHFWIGVVLAGVVAPVALGLIARKGPKARTSACLGGALACLLVGSVVLRVVMYAVATSVQQLIY